MNESHRKSKLNSKGHNKPPSIMSEIIALFGATGGTGKHFVTAALAAGYKVQALARTPSKVTAADGLAVVEGDFGNTEAIAKTLKGATYVVSMGGGPMGKPKEYPADLMLNFVKTLLAEAQKVKSIKVLLYQAGFFAALPDGTLPFMLKILRTVIGSWYLGIGPNIMDHEAIIKYIDEQKDSLPFKTIVTRPGGLDDSEGGKTLKASEDPEMSVIAFKDLAAFSLEAMKDESLYGTYPFIKLA